MTDPANDATRRDLVTNVAAQYSRPHFTAKADQALAVGRQEIEHVLAALLIGRREGNPAGTANMILAYLWDRAGSLTPPIALAALIELAEIREAVADGAAAAQAKGDQP